VNAYREHMARSLRGALLHALAEAPAEAASTVVLHAVLAEGAYRAGMASIDEAVRWLAERRLVAVEEVGGALFATITEAGMDIVAGREGDPGIRRIRPR
jgi:hypothetical protein